MKSKEFQGTCVENPFRNIETLCDVVEKAIKITKRTFLQHCFIHCEILKNMKQFPNDYEFFKYKNIYFYRWSAIEHFYW
jgi:hypothetical protein